MEPVTHILTGACIARAGLNRRAAYATLTMAIAAELPDIDTVWSFRGPVEGFIHHRGITHTFAGIAVEAAMLTAVLWLAHQARLKRSHLRKNPKRPLTAAPVRWRRLYGFALLGLLSHLFLDYTNNYGLRPFFPFRPTWYAGSFVFIFDPLLFGILLASLTLPALFGLIGAEVGERKPTFRSAGWSLAALLLIATYWSVRAVNHARAERLAQQESASAHWPAPDGAVSNSFATPQRVTVGPDPLDPFRWHAALDFGGFVQQAEIDLHTGSVTRSQQVYAKPDRTPALAAAEASHLGSGYLDWSPIPIVTVLSAAETPQAAMPDAPPRHTIVMFRDPRFMIDVPILRERSLPPLTGAVELDEQNRVVRQAVDGVVQK